MFNMGKGRKSVGREINSVMYFHTHANTDLVSRCLVVMPVCFLLIKCIKLSLNPVEVKRVCQSEKETGRFNQPAHSEVKATSAVTLI